MEQAIGGKETDADGLSLAGHSSRQYDQDLEWIRSKVLLMGGLVEEQFRDAMAAMEKGDVTLAEKVVAGDDRVNRQEVELDHACAQLIVRRQPAANDLRNVMATVKVISDLERMGDETTKIARAVKNIRSGDLLLSGHYRAVIGMSHTARRMMHEALDAYARMDTAAALALMAVDDVVDAEFHDIVCSLIEYMRREPEAVEAGVNLLRAAKAIERIGDHATNIAEFIVYVVEGKDIRHTDYRLQTEGTMR